MTVVALQRRLDAVRATADYAVASVHGYDLSSTLNCHHEKLLDEPAPGASAATYTGHPHDSVTGRGILRAVNGGFCVAEAVLSFQVTNGNVHSMAEGSSSNYESVAPDYAMGIAYVGHGLPRGAGSTTMRCAVQIKASDDSEDPQVAILNITDGLPAAYTWTSITTSPVWYELDVEVAAPAPAAQYRIKLDIKIRVQNYVSSDPTFYLYAAFPYEHLNEA